MRRDDIAGEFLDICQYLSMSSLPQLETTLEVTREGVSEAGGLAAQKDLVKVPFSHLAFVDLMNSQVRHGRIEDAVLFSSAIMDTAQAQ